MRIAVSKTLGKPQVPKAPLYSYIPRDTDNTSVFLGNTRMYTDWVGGGVRAYYLGVGEGSITTAQCVCEGALGDEPRAP